VHQVGFPLQQLSQNISSPKMLFFCADYIFTTYAPLADEKENNFNRKFVGGTCRIYPCNDTNKLHNKILCFVDRASWHNSCK